MDRWWKRIRDELNRKGWSVVEFERRTGIDRGRLYKYVTGEVDQPRGDAFSRMSTALGVNEWWLRTGQGARSNRLPILGTVEAGETWTAHGAGGERNFVDFDLDAEDYVALEVSGTSMSPAYRNGDVVICAKRPNLAVLANEFNGIKRMDCAVQTVEGIGYLKIVMPGKRPGLFTLRSYNPDFADIEDVQLEWLAPVVWIKRSR